MSLNKSCANYENKCTTRRLPVLTSFTMFLMSRLASWRSSAFLLLRSSANLYEKAEKSPTSKHQFERAKVRSFSRPVSHRTSGGQTEHSTAQHCPCMHWENSNWESFINQLPSSGQGLPVPVSVQRLSIHISISLSTAEGNVCILLKITSGMPYPTLLFVFKHRILGPQGRGRYECVITRDFWVHGHNSWNQDPCSVRLSWRGTRLTTSDPIPHGITIIISIATISTTSSSSISTVVNIINKNNNHCLPLKLNK